MNSRSRDEIAEKKQQLKYVLQNLEAAYGVPRNHHHDDPLDELIGTILSQSTSDINSHRAFASLKHRFPTWEAAQTAPAAEIEAAIQSGGLARVKSIVIQNVLNEVSRRRGSLDLSFLKTAPLDEAHDFLLSLKGVGPKTAACVLLFACKRNLFPMDTHILRICRRLALIPEKESDARAHQRMLPLVPPRKHYSLHVNLIRLGKQICRPQNPICEKCPLIEHCPVGQSQL